MDYFSQHIFSDPEKKTLDYNYIAFGFFKILINDDLSKTFAKKYIRQKPCLKEAE